MNLTKLSETATTITLGWTPVPGCVGYRFTAEKQAKPSHTWDPARASVRFAKGSAWYKVGALGVAEQGTYPSIAPEPPATLPVWNGDLSTGDMSQYGNWEWGGMSDGSPPISERVSVVRSVDGVTPAQGDYLMRIATHAGDAASPSDGGWRTLTRLPPEHTNNGNLVMRRPGYDSALTWIARIPSGYPGDAKVWVAGPEWHHAGAGGGPASVAPFHSAMLGDRILVDLKWWNGTAWVYEVGKPGAMHLPQELLVGQVLRLLVAPVPQQLPDLREVRQRLLVDGVVRAARPERVLVELDSFAGDAAVRQHLLDPVGGRGYVARRVRRIDREVRAEEPHGLVRETSEIDVRCRSAQRLPPREADYDANDSR